MKMILFGPGISVLKNFWKTRRLMILTIIAWRMFSLDAISKTEFSA